MPPNGVYITVSYFKERTYQGITNIGYKPTVGGEKFLGVETYLFDCHEDLYGQYCRVDFKKFLRPEQKFTSLEALKKQLEKDAVKGQEYFRKKNKKRVYTPWAMCYTIQGEFSPCSGTGNSDHPLICGGPINNNI